MREFLYRLHLVSVPNEACCVESIICVHNVAELLDGDEPNDVELTKI